MARSNNSETVNRFTPLNAERTQRLEFNRDDVKLISGNLHARRLGMKAVIEIHGEKYKVYGISCGLPNCQCDAKIVPITN
jgi:hypothetical protein